MFNMMKALKVTGWTIAIGVLTTTVGLAALVAYNMYLWTH